MVAQNGSFKDKYPTIALKWHLTKNGTLTAYDVTATTKKSLVGMPKWT